MSIKKIAQLTGSSPATVSRVLNNPQYKCSKPGLREKIWKMAMELNYTPNEAARNLKKGEVQREKAYYIDILMTRMDGKHTDPFFTELLRVVESQIHDHGCILSHIWYRSIFSDDRKCERYSIASLLAELFAEMDTPRQGLILIGRCNPQVVKELKKYYKNIVSINRNSTNYEIDEVLCDGRKIAAAALEHLIALGHRRIAYVGKCHHEARYQGYLDVMHQHGIEYYPEYVIEMNQTERKGVETMQHFLQMDEPPTGIYCANDITAVGMLKCLKQYKNLIYTPSIISSDGIEEGENTTPMLTTVQLPKENMAKFAMYLLLDRIKGGHTEVVRIELEGKLLHRSSTAPVEESSHMEYYI